MAIDTSGFVVPERSAEGLYKIADTVERNRYRDEQLRQQQRGERAASSRFFENYLDKKDRYTGTDFDPKKNELLSNALDQARTLINTGADQNQIFTAIAPLVNKVNEYEQKAKQYADYKKQYLDNLKFQKGFNLDKVGAAIDEVAFKNEDGTEKDLDKVDPAMFGEYVKSAFATKSGLTSKLGNLPELLRKNDLIETKARVKSINSRGGSSLSDSDVKMYDWMQTDNEGNFAPKYEHALDGDQYVKHKFAENDKEGKVRLLDKKVFDNIISEDPAYHQKLMEEIRSAGYTGDFEHDEGSYNAARALAYMDADQYKRGYIKSVAETKERPIRISMGNSSKQVEPIDLSDENEYPSTGDGGKNVTKLFQGVKVTGLPSGKSYLAKKIIFYPSTGKVKYQEYTDEEDKNGNFPEKTTDLQTLLNNIRTLNPATDMRFIEGLKKTQTSSYKQPAQRTVSYNIKGKVYSEKELLDMGYTLDDIKSYKQ